MLFLRTLADAHNPDSLSNRLRAKRFRLFEQLIASLPRPVRIIDLGGTIEFWQRRGWAGRADAHITTVNLEAEPSRFTNMRTLRGDVTDLSHLADYSFDVAFSNSVIEHLFTTERQAMMARQMQRLAPALWLQTPNYWFPIEPHFHVPGWQWLPVATRVAIIRRTRCGWRERCPDRRAAQRSVREVRLLTRRQLQRLFPNATIVPERIGPLTKSFIVTNGFSSFATLRAAA